MANQSKYLDPIVDWQQVVCDLKKVGMNWRQQAKEVGVCRRTIGNWEHGICEPTFSCGYRLLDVYQTVFGTSPSSSERPLLLQIKESGQDIALKSL